MHGAQGRMLIDLILLALGRLCEHQKHTAAREDCQRACSAQGIVIEVRDGHVSCLDQSHLYACMNTHTHSLSLGLLYPSSCPSLSGTCGHRFDFSGNGESEGAFTFSNYLKEVSDLQCAVRYVKEKLQRKVVACIGECLCGEPALPSCMRVASLGAQFDLL
jgi:hypothetical protein